MQTPVSSTTTLFDVIAAVKVTQGNRGDIRAVIVDGRARVAVADRRTGEGARSRPDVRVRPSKVVTVRHAANAILHRDPTNEVARAHAQGSKRDVASGALREEYLRIVGR